MSSGRSKETASTSFLKDLFCRTDVYYVFIMKWGWVKFADTTERSYLKFVLWAKGEQQQQKNVPTTAHTSKKSSYCIWYGIWFKMKEFFCQFSFSQKTWRFWCVQQNSPLTCVVVMVMEEFLEENVKKKKEQNFFFFAVFSMSIPLTAPWPWGELIPDQCAELNDLQYPPIGPVRARVLTKQQQASHSISWDCRRGLFSPHYHLPTQVWIPGQAGTVGSAIQSTDHRVRWW